MKSYVIGIAALAAASLFASGYSGHPTDFETRVDEHLAEVSRHDLFSGTILVSTCDGRINYGRGIGLANRTWSVPNSVDTKFRVASITKQFTAATILRLMEEGRLHLDDLISSHLPGFPKPVADQVTLHQLLSNTSGIPNIFEVPGAQERLPFIRSTQDVLDIFWGESLDFEPGSRYTYSNSNYDILGAIIERITGVSYGEAIAEYVFEPLGLAATGYFVENTVISGIASGYSRGVGDYAPAPYFNSRSVFAAGMAYSSAPDLHTFNCALNSGRLFEAPASLNAMTTPHFPGSGYGYGQIIETFVLGDEQVLKTGHGGDLPGIATQNWYFPEHELSIIVLGNSEGRESRSRAMEIAKIYFGDATPPLQKNLAWDLLKIIRADGIDAGTEFYRVQEQSSASPYRLSEQDLNAVGYELLWENNTSDAIEIFKLATEYYPESANAFDSLGEGYLLVGDQERALVNYSKSVELNPDNDAANRVIRTLTGN